MAEKKGTVAEVLRDAADLVKRYRSPLLLAGLTLVSFLLLWRAVPIPVQILLAAAGVCAAFGCSRRSALVYLVLLGLFTCFERHFIIHYGESFFQVGNQALITLHITDMDEVVAYLSIFKAVELLLCLLFAAGSVAVFRWGSVPPTIRRRTIAAAAFLLLAGAVGWEIVPPVVEHLRTWGVKKEFYLTRHDFRFGAVDRDPGSELFCLLVIGESHRKAEFDELVLGGDVAPTLKTARKRGELWEFDDLITHYPQTYYSVFTLLSRRGADSMDLLWPEKGLFGLFREAGWKTCVISYQLKEPEKFGFNYVLNEAEEYFCQRDYSSSKFDQGMLIPLDAVMKRKKKKMFAVLKMVGVHFHYASRYPKDAAVYRPCYKEKMKRSAYSPKEKQILVNTYRNAMRFSGTFLEEVARRIDRHETPAVMIFLSDHGVVNYDDGQNPFFGAAKSNFHIPCLIYGNAAFRRKVPPETAAALRKNRTLPSSNRYLFETLVTLAGLDYPGRRPQLDLASPEAKAAIDRMVWVWKTPMHYDTLP